MTTVVKLGEVCDIRSGGTPLRSNKAYYGGKIPWVKIGDLVDDQSITTTEETITEAGLNAIRGRVFSKGTLLFAIYGSMGKMGFAGTDLATNQAILGLNPKKDGSIWLRYLYHYLNEKKQELQNAGRGVTQKNLSAKFLRELLVPLPEMSEQQRIAAILDKGEGIRRKREQALATSYDFLKSSYLSIVGNRNPHYAEWDSLSVEELAEDRTKSIRSGPFGSALRHGEFVDDGIAVLGIDNAVQNKFAWTGRRFITEEKYEELRRYKVFPHDVIVTIMGTTGRSAVVPADIPEAITTKHLATITCNIDLIHPELLSFAIHSDPTVIRQIEAKNKGAIMDGLNLGIIRKLVIHLPPMEEQLRFVSILQKVRAMEDLVARPKSNASDLFKSLSQRAFSGKREVQPCA